MLPELRILYFEDLVVGLSEELRKVIAASDVVGFAEVTGDRNPIHLSEHFRRAHALRPPHRPRPLYGEPDLRRAGHAPAGTGRDLYLADAEFPRAGEDRRRGVVVRVEVAELIAERRRARLACTCSVAGEVVLDGEAWIKVPSRAEADRNPLGA